jgi:tyrosinase
LDWVADSAAPGSAKIWDPVTGFGGNGNPTNTSDPYGYCVTDGPFKKLTLAYKSNDTHSHCLERDFIPAYPQAGLQELLGWDYTPAIISTIMANNNYGSFHPALEGGPHNIIHGAVGGSYGDMGPLTSPNGMSLLSSSLSFYHLKKYPHCIYQS